MLLPRRTLAILLAIMGGAVVQASLATSQRAELPDGFVHLSTIDPTILQDIRYAGPHNFTGRPVPDYEAANCILTLKAAEALRGVQDRLREMALSLKVYDCYRPARAVEAFAAWTESEGGEETKAEFFPDIDKSELFTLGWLARRSGHSRGSSVDVAIMPLPPPVQRAYVPGEPLARCDAPREQRFPDNSLDFGTGYDCFSEKSYTADTSIGDEARKNRDLLVRLMRDAGFRNYQREWWHFDFSGEPFPHTYFDFSVTAPPS